MFMTLILASHKFTSILPKTKKALSYQYFLQDKHINFYQLIIKTLITYRLNKNPMPVWRHFGRKKMSSHSIYENYLHTTNIKHILNGKKYTQQLRLILTFLFNYFKNY